MIKKTEIGNPLQSSFVDAAQWLEITRLPLLGVCTRRNGHVLHSLGPPHLAVSRWPIVGAKKLDQVVASRFHNPRQICAPETYARTALRDCIVNDEGDLPCLSFV